MLELNNITKSFGGIKAVNNVSMYFTKNKITALVGPNGAGKTTVFNIISGFIKPDKGEIYYKEKDITMMPSWKRGYLGIGRIFQDNKIFPYLSCLENVVVAVKNNLVENPLNSVFRLKKTKEIEKENAYIAKKWLDFVGLGDKLNTKAENLSYGQQKLLAFARLMANGADLFLLDEPTAGVNPYMISQILSFIKKIANEEGKTVVLIEHNLGVVLEVADSVYFIEEGEVKTFGTPKDVLSDPRVKEAYTGL